MKQMMLSWDVRRLESKLKAVNVSVEDNCRVTRDAIVIMADPAQHLATSDKAGVELFSTGCWGPLFNS
jgi:hypothetical protein